MKFYNCILGVQKIQFLEICRAPKYPFFNEELDFEVEAT